MKRIFSLFLALVMLAALCCSCSGGAKTTLYLLNWGEYLDPALIEEFEEQNPDIRVNMTTTTTNEEMYTVCATEGTKIDIVVPSDYLVERFIAEDLLAELDFSNIPNFQYVEKAAQNRTFDPENKYSVPYFIGTVGIVYNKTLVDEEVDSWGILWDEKYANQIMMYDSIRDSMMVALAYLGYDINTTDPEELAEAGDLLLAQKPLVRGYGADNIKYDMIGGGVALGVDYSGSAVQAIMENEDLAYVVPKEGSNVWMDNFVVLKSSRIRRPQSGLSTSCATRKFPRRIRSLSAIQHPTKPLWSMLTRNSPATRPIPFPTVFSIAAPTSKILGMLCSCITTNG